MNILTILVTAFVVACITFPAGFAACIFLRNSRRYSGTIKITQEENKVLYSLELHEDPIVLQHVSEVVFKVETST